VVRRVSGFPCIVLCLWLAVASLAHPAAARATPEVTPEASPVLDVEPAGTSGGCTTGQVGSGDAYFPTMGNGGYDVQHYALDLTIDVAGSGIEAATARIDALALVDLCAFNLDFEGLTIDGVRVNGAPATVRRLGKELTVTPETPLAAASTFTVDVRYHGTPVQATMTPEGLPAAASAADLAAGIGGGDADEAIDFQGGWFAAEDEIFTLGEPSGNRFWYPVNEHPSDKATYSARYTVPDPYVVEGNGSLVATIDNGDTTTFAWDSRDPIASYLVTFHAGLLEIEELEGPHGLPIRLSFAPNVPESQREVLRRLPEMVAFAETVFGPYPFESIGGTVTSTRQGLALETQTLPVYGSLGDSRDAQVSARSLDVFELTVIHELAHQWFGNSVSVQAWQDIWLNEGFASYSEALWLERTRGEEARDDLLREFYRDNASAARWATPGALDGLTGADVLKGLEAVGGPPDDPCYGETLGVAHDGFDEGPAQDMISALAACGVPPDIFPGRPILTGDPGGPNLFSYTGIYGRGALTAHALRLAIGDAAFFALARDWTTRYANGNAATVDFMRLAEDVSGQDLDGLFDAWLFELALPELDLS